MTETFVPLPRPAGSSRESGFTPLPMKLFSQPVPSSAHNDSCREPVLTFQRDGDKIKSIHIECACGQVMDLVCEY
jgi:hypothetical protein